MLNDLESGNRKAARVTLQHRDLLVNTNGM